MSGEISERVANPSPQPGSATRRPTLLTVCPFVPYPTVPHAGGQYLYAHLTALSAWFDCRLVAPETPDNRAAVERGGHVFRPVLAARATPRRSALAESLRATASAVLRPVHPEMGFAAALQQRVLQELEEADLVELQWPEYVGLVPGIKRQAPDVPIIVVEHDVLSQRVLRDARHAGSRRTRFRALLTAGRVRRLERTYLNRTDRVIVFSGSDADLLRAGGVRTPVEAVLPPLEDARMSGTGPAPRCDRSRILLVAAFDRDVNDAGARWFVREIFPLVRTALPEARLILAGAGVRDGLRDLAERTPGIEMTGFVEDLGPVYQRAEVAIAPLLRGAGLKFKVATAMMWGLPVVATTVGAEGYPRERGIFLGVEDDPQQFAAAVVRALVERDVAREVAGAGQRWALWAFSERRFGERLHAIYSAVVPNVWRDRGAS